jgi:predicted nuclease with TOPRIM domain
MDFLDEILAKGKLLKLYHQIENNVREIEAKTPNRTDFTVPMNEALQDLAFSIAIFDELRNELKLYKSHCSTLNLNVQLRDVEIEKLKKKNDELMSFL